MIKIENSYFTPIINLRMNTRKVIEMFKKFRIILGSGCCYTIIMVNTTSKLRF